MKSLQKKLLSILGIIIGVFGLAMLFDVLEAILIKFLHLGFLWNLSLGIKTIVGVVLIIIAIVMGASWNKITKAGRK